MKNASEQKLIIAGPCALESEDHARITIDEAKKTGIEIVRMNLWKPRTIPGYEGVGATGLPWLREAAQEDLGIALEVMNPEQADLVMEEILSAAPHATLILWIGSRNQNHILQRDIAITVAGQKNVKLMLKNQPWRDKKHWKGMVAHALSGGIAPEQLMLCHRGFTPWDKDKEKLRNIPDLEMAQQVKIELAEDDLLLPMILDPSHIGGTVLLVQELAKEFGQANWVDGQIIEVHPDPKNAKTDSKQQLTWEQLRELMPFIIGQE